MTIIQIVIIRDIYKNGSTINAVVDSVYYANSNDAGEKIIVIFKYNSTQKEKLYFEKKFDLSQKEKYKKGNVINGYINNTTTNISIDLSQRRNYLYGLIVISVIFIFITSLIILKFNKVLIFMSKIEFSRID
jgi:hypothetical protein